MLLCPWSLASRRSVLGLGFEIFLCSWPWPRALCPRLHFCPEHVIKSFMAKKIKQFNVVCKLGPERCLVYLRLLWLGSVFSRFKKQAKSAVKQCFSAVELRFVYNINELLSATNKHVLLALQKSNVIYQFSCLCDSRYVSRNSHRLQDKIKLRVSKSIRSCSSSQNRLLSARQCKSSI